MEGTSGEFPRFRKYYGLISILFGFLGLTVFLGNFIFNGPVRTSFEVIYFIRGTQTIASAIAIIFGSFAVAYHDKKGALGILFGSLGLSPLIINVLFPPMYE